MALVTNLPPPAKDPLATLDYSFNWSSWLQSGETIVSATVNVPAGITLSQSATIVGGSVVFWLSGGLAYQSYPIECEITTNQGRTDSRSFQLTCQVR